MKTQDIKNIALALKNIRENAIEEAYGNAPSNADADQMKQRKALQAKKNHKEDNSNDVSDDGDGLDKVQPKAVKKKFKDRKDKDIDNDGDTDSSDEFLHKKRKAISKAMKEDTLDFENMADEEFDEILEASNSPEELDELIGAIARGAGSLVKKVGGAVASRVTTAGRADRAQAKLKKMKTKVANRKKLDTAKAGIAALKKTNSPITGKPKPKPLVSSKNSDVEVQEAATATHKPNNGADAEDGLSPNGKKMMAMKTDAPEGADITKVAPKTFAAMRASGKKAAGRNNDNAQGDKTPPKNDGK